MTDLIQAMNLTKIYSAESPVVALQQVDLAVPVGSFTTITGPSGSGKSTLLNLLGTLDVPTDGELFFEQHLLTALSLDELAVFRRKKIGFVFQLFYLLPALTALENVMLPLLPFQHKIGFKLIERAKELLCAVGLENRGSHFPAQLSGGECQRVAIARALINSPILLLADEPTGNLDSKSSKEILQLLMQLNHVRGTTLIMVTHNDEIAKLSDQVVKLRDGKVTII